MSLKLDQETLNKPSLLPDKTIHNSSISRKNTNILYEEVGAKYGREPLLL